MLRARLLFPVLSLAGVGCSGVDSTSLLGPGESPPAVLPQVPPPEGLPVEQPAPPPLDSAAGCRVDGVWPAFGARDVPITIQPEVYFSTPLEASIEGALQLTRLDDGSAVPFDLEWIDPLSVRLTPRQELAFWQSYTLSVGISELPCAGALGTFSTPSPEFVPPPLRTAAALDIARQGAVVYSTAPTFHGLQVHRIEGDQLRLLGDVHWPQASNGVRVLGERAYVPAGAQGVVILDLSAPETPRVLGVAGVPGGASDVAPFRSAERELLAAAAGSEGVVVVDVTDPERSVVVSRFDISGTRRNTTVDVDLDGTLLAVADGYNGLFSLELSDPAAPVLLGRSPDASAQRVQIAGDRLYALFAGWPRIRSYAASQPTEKLAEWNTCGLPCGLFSVDFDVLGDALYAATSQGGALRVAANPDGTLTQSSVAPLRARSAVQTVLAAEDATLIGEVGGLALFLPDGSGPFGFDPNGHGDARAVAVRGRYAYVAASFAGLQVFDLSVPLHPRWVGRVDTPGMTSAHDVATTRVTVDGDVLLLSDGRAGLSVYRLTDPERPALVASFSDDVDHIDDVALVGNGAYACNDNSGVDLISFPEGGAPLRTKPLRFASGESHSCLTIARHPSEPLLYLGDLRGLGIYAEGAGGELTLVSDYVPPLGGGVGILAFAGQRLIAATSAQDYAEGSSNGTSARLHVLDVSDPRAPVELWHSEPLGTISTLAVAGQKLFVGGGIQLSVYDVSRSVPELEGSVTTQSTIRHLLATPDAVYVAQSTGGLGVLSTGPLPPRPGEGGVSTPRLVR